MRNWLDADYQNLDLRTVPTNTVLTQVFLGAADGYMGETNLSKGYWKILGNHTLCRDNIIKSNKNSKKL